MATSGGYTVLVLNSILLIIVRRELNKRKPQLQLEHLKIVVVVMISLRVFQPFKSKQRRLPKNETGIGGTCLVAETSCTEARHKTLNLAFSCCRFARNNKMY